MYFVIIISYHTICFLYIIRAFCLDAHLQGEECGFWILGGKIVVQFCHGCEVRMPISSINRSISQSINVNVSFISLEIQIKFISFFCIRKIVYQHNCFGINIEAVVSFREYTNSSRDKTHQKNCWQLITLYLNSTQDVFEHKNKQDLSESKLIGK